jgi:hypothetical protein
MRCQHRVPLTVASPRVVALYAGATCLFAYLYVRPSIRRRLGSASRWARWRRESLVYCWLEALLTRPAYHHR